MNRLPRKGDILGLSQDETLLVLTNPVKITKSFQTPDYWHMEIFHFGRREHCTARFSGTGGGKGEDYHWCYTLMAEADQE